MGAIRFYGVEDAITVQKTNGTNVSYYIFEESEIHLNRIEPGSVQEWHYHTLIDECLLITRGTLTCRWMEDGAEKRREVHEREIVRVGTSVHTFANETEEAVEFVVFRFVPEGKDKREIIKNDKVVVEDIR